MLRRLFGCDFSFLLRFRVVLGNAERFCDVGSFFFRDTFRKNRKRKNKTLADLSAETDGADAEFSVAQELKLRSLRNDGIDLYIDAQVAF